MKRVTNVEGRPRGIINLGEETLNSKTKLINPTETKLNRIAKLSAEDPEMTFKWLMPHVNKVSLISCYHKLDGRKAVGVDGSSKEE